ncbi:tetratricopeptide repeat protein [Pseudoalteromonas mariniglutinosa]|uniref:tetratricopeptide repeat protein n=1 Tax=Pseudoalteromonas mariniglutinosa TaxID=206042 RepID=UPI00384C71F5
MAALKYTCVISLCYFLIACSTIEKLTFNAPMQLIEQHNYDTIYVEQPKDIFALDEHVKTQIDNAFPTDQRDLAATRQLLNFLLANGDASLSYQSDATLTANQTYYDLNANCLSLSILAYSLAEYLGLTGQFQRVHIPEYWALNNGFNLLTGHINLRVKASTQQKVSQQIIYNRENSLVIDFDPNSRQQQFDTSFISKARVTAMFYNNKGAAAMLQDDYDSAFNYFKAAITSDRYYSGAWGNLGVLFRLDEQFQHAETAYHFAITVDENNHTALGNLALLYNLTDRAEQAKAILAMLDRKRQDNPYYHISLGNDAYSTMHYQDALKHYKKAKKLDPVLHDADFGLARTYYQLGDLKLAHRYLIRAHSKADFEHDKQRYQQKLQLFRNTRDHVAKN